MTSFKRSVFAIFFFVLLVTGCEPDTTITGSVTPGAARQAASISPELKAKLARFRASLPAGHEKRLQISSPLLAKIHPEYRQMVAQAITPTPCNANTPLNQWLNQQLSDWDADIFYLASASGMLDFPTYDALLFENSSANQYFGVTGDYTQRTTKAFKDLRRFWNIQSDNMVLGAMHGSMLLNREKLIRIDKILFGDSQATAEYYADLIITLLNEVPQYRRGDHPIFTFNAFAQPGFAFPPVGVIPDKIIMGDGIVEAYNAIGYGDVATPAILAHEYGHHIQFQLGLFEEEESPEATRRTELMADAYSAYFLSHARGASMQWKRVKLFLQVFLNIGDCGFTSAGHHGTPTQRMASAEWGYSVANDAQKQGHILTSQDFTTLFEAQLPVLVTY